MKKRLFFRIICLVLCLGMTVTTAQAAGNGARGWIDWIRSRVEQVVGGWTNPGQGGNSGSENTGSGEQDWSLIEDGTTVTNGDMLRASTYTLSDSGTSVQADNGTTLKYFPITLYDYDTDTINNATHRADLEANPDSTEWQGMYFSSGSPSASVFTYAVSSEAKTGLTWANVQNGTYYYDTDCTIKVSVSEITEVSGYAVASVTFDNLISSDSSEWKATNYFYKSGDNYYTLYAKRSSTDYTNYYKYSFGYTTTGSTDNITSVDFTTYWYGNYYTETPSFTVYTTAKVTTGYTLKAGSQTIATLSSTDTSKEIGITLYAADKTTTTSSRTYAEWNWWNKNSGNNENGDLIYTGLLEDTLDRQKDPVFTVPDGGIFNSDTTVKSVYTNVGMPFVYENQTYTFDASQNGVYFHEDTTQGSSGTAASNTRLYFDEGTPQSPYSSNSQYPVNWGDGSKTVWAPFDDSTSISGYSSHVDMNYHFGMRATIPFTMTSNGRMSQNDDTSDPIQFSFSGDDDVWVFIDGQLVVDLGGIHNRLNVEIDFAANTVTYSENNDQDTDNNTGSYNDANFATTQTLFTTDDAIGLISQDRETFSASDTHELTIFYLERGEGTSNCKISFNLPMKDTLTVTKRATRSWIAEKDEVSPLTAAEQAIVDNIDFGFTLYKKEANETTFQKVSSTRFNLLDKDGQVIDTRSTDSNGHFILKNGQSARFVTDFSADGVTYYVVEDSLAGSAFVTPDFTYSGTAADGFTVDETRYDSASSIPEQIIPTDATENKSYEVTVRGSDESEDSLVFICENFLDATIPNPSIYPADDKIVIDYGLGVDIDVLANDPYRGDTIELLRVCGADLTVDDNGNITESSSPIYGKATITDGKIHYQLTEQLTHVEVLNYVVKVTSSGGSDYEQNVASKYAVGTVYIIPATTMYYEEDFAGLVTYTNGKSDGWQAEGSAQTDNQEPGVVGTVADSPYGSDVAYLSDGGDSNGSSMYVDTTSGAAQFSYTFTGTGTSFFARTTTNSGYMRVVVKDEDGNAIQSLYRDTKWMNSDESSYKLKDEEYLYNIPVFTSNALDYGTYTVTVTIAKAAPNVGYGSEFWLDGIRVFNPLDESDANYGVATSAYASDGEANMTNVTLRNKILRVDSYDDENTGELTYENGTFVVLTDNNGKITTAAEYESDGPKEEVYLYNGQTISFSLYDWDPDSNKLYLGMKAPTGSATVTVGSTTITLNNAADCYYEISNYATVSTDTEDGVKTATFTIEAGDGALVSVTNIRVTGNAEFTIIPKEDIDADGSEGGDSDENVTVDGDDTDSEGYADAAGEVSGSDDET